MMFGYTRQELEDYFAFHIDKWLQEKKYYEPFLSEGKEILMVGIGFNREDKNIVQFMYVKFES
jgi:hypothetical protein